MNYPRHEASIDDALPVYEAFLTGPESVRRDLVARAQAGELHPPELNDFVGKVVLFLADVGVSMDCEATR